MFVVILFTSIIAIFGVIGITASPKCTDIVDIYYNPKSVDFAYDKQCPYTKTEACASCQTYYVSRGNYDDWAEGFTKIGLQPPYAKRNDTNNVIYHNNENK